MHFGYLICPDRVRGGDGERGREEKGVEREKERERGKGEEREGERERQTEREREWEEKEGKRKGCRETLRNS